MSAARRRSTMDDRVPTRVSGAPRGRAGVGRECATCEFRYGILTTDGWGYYSSSGGTQMLVVERGPNQRIRINGSIEIVILETDHEKVRLGIEGLPDSHTHTRGWPHAADCRLPKN